MSETETRPNVFLGMPTSGSHPHIGVAQSLFYSASRNADLRVMYNGHSSLPQNFNVLWTCGLMYPEADYFVMLHDDILPCEWWVDILLDEIQRHDADVVSVVNAIKDQKGLTSTGTGHPDDPYDYHRITTAELHDLPETFGVRDLPGSITAGGRSVLLVNTGCWIANLRRPFWREMNEDGTLRFCFEQRHRISFDEEEQRYCAEFAPEDWLFSRTCHDVGAKVLATRRVKTNHMGTTGFPNNHAWGDLKFDHEADQFHKTKPLSRERVLA